MRNIQRLNNNQWKTKIWHYIKPNKLGGMVSVRNLWYKFIRWPWTASYSGFVVHTLLLFTLLYTMCSSVPTLNYKKSVVWNIEPLDLVVSFFDFWLSTFDFLIAWQHLLMFSDRSFELLESSLLLIVQLQ